MHTVPGIAFVRELEGIKEFQLKKNGLRILLVPQPASPVAGCMVTYHVGSRNEVTGYTGATHLLEHLMFKGSKSFSPELGTAMDKLLEERGAVVNATTWLDRTNYYEVVPRDALPLAIEIEADRMRTARIEESDRQSEMPVVRNEFERGENLPHEALDKELWSAAFIAHPYHHSTIGWRSDIENVSIERLKAFYDEFYWPNNATVTIVGGFDEVAILKLIKKHFGVHPKAPHVLSTVTTEEPPQQGQRRVVVKRAGVPLVATAHKIPHALHEDMPALVVLATILADDKSSRLYKALIDEGFATDVSAFVGQFFDPSLFQMFVTLLPTASHAKVEQVLINEYARVASEGVTKAELASAKRSLRAQDAQRRDGPYMLLATLNEELATGDWTRFVTFPRQVAQVTAAEVKRVAKKYLVEDTSVVGWFVPNV